MTYVDTLGQQAKVASRQIAKLSTAAKNDLLNQVAKALVAESDYIITENAKDMANASENGISKIMQDRLLLTEDRIAGIAEGVRQVADLQDPIGQVVRGYTNLDGLKIVQKRVPMGVIAMILRAVLMFQSMLLALPLRLIMPLFFVEDVMLSIPIRLWLR